MDKSPTIILPSGNTYDGFRTFRRRSTAKLVDVEGVPEGLHERFGLRLAQCIVSVSNLPSFADFYKKRLGTTMLGKATPSAQSDSFCFINFHDERDADSFQRQGKLWCNQRTAMLEAHAAHRVEGTTNTNIPRKDNLLKIGVETKDVTHVTQLLARHMVSLTSPSQFYDIGYLARLRDSEGFVLEMLQHTFQNTFVSEAADNNLYLLGYPLSMSHIHIQVSDITESLVFYCKVLGLKLLSRQTIPSGSSAAYYLGWTAESPPVPNDFDALVNREWLCQRPYTMLVLHHDNSPDFEMDPYEDIQENEAGFLGLGVLCLKTAAPKFVEYLKDHGVDVIEDRDDGLECDVIRIRDPDNIPIRIALWNCLETCS